MADDRARDAILGGLGACIVERGYAATSVSDIVAAGRVSKSTFYGLFTDKEAALLEIYRRATSYQLAVVRTAEARTREAGLNWRGRLEETLRAFLTTFAAGGAITRCLLVEAPGISGAALLARRAALDQYGELLHELAESVSAEEGFNATLSPAMIIGAVGGMNELTLQAFEAEEVDLVRLVADATELFGLLFVASGAREPRH